MISQIIFCLIFWIILALAVSKVLDMAFRQRFKIKRVVTKQNRVLWFVSHRQNFKWVVVNYSDTKRDAFIYCFIDHNSLK